MIEHLFDEALLVALREGRREMNFDDVMEAKFNEEIGLKQPVVYTEARTAKRWPRTRRGTPPSPTSWARTGVSRCCRSSSGEARSGCWPTAIPRNGSRAPAREIEAGIAIALGGLVAEELCIGDTGTGPAGDLAHATTPRRQHGRVRSAWRAR